MNLFIEDGSFTAGIFDSRYTFGNLKVTSPREVTLYEIEVFDESGGVTYIGDTPYKIRKGAVLVAKPGDIRHTALPLKTHYVKIQPGTPLIDNLLCGLSSYFTVSRADDYLTDIKEMFSTYRRDPLMRLSLLFKLLSQLQKDEHRSRQLDSLPKMRSKEAVEKALEYMDAHFREKCTGKELAAAVHFSPIYFHTLFTEAMGETPYAYLKKLRLEEAKRLLLTESLSVGEIAEESGFQSQAYFNDVFKKETGKTPSAYRKIALEKYLSENGKL